MISLARISKGEAENLPVHENCDLFTFNSDLTDSIESARPIATGPPFVLIETFIVGGVHNGGLPLGERDETIVCRWGCHWRYLLSVGMGLQAR